MLGNLLADSMMFHVRYYSHQMYEAALKLLGQMELYAIGSTREFMRNPKLMIQHLTADARKNEAGLSLISLGPLSSYSKNNTWFLLHVV